MSEKEGEGIPRWAKRVALWVLIAFVAWCVLAFIAQRVIVPDGVIV